MKILGKKLISYNDKKQKVEAMSLLCLVYPTR